MQNRNLMILFSTLVVVMFGFGMVIPIMPFYIQEFGASGRDLGALMATYGVLQFICAPIWGSLSDRYGRKPVLMLGVLGNALAQVLFGLSTQLWMLFAARALAGILSSATLPTAMAYISDSTSKAQRGGGMGLIGAAMGVGMVVGPGLGGSLAVQSLSLPFFVAAVLSLVSLALVGAFLPEPHHASPAELSHRPPQQLGLLRRLVQALQGPQGVLFLMAFLLTFGLTNFEGVFGLYAAKRYGYNPSQVGLVLTVIGIVAATTQGVLTGPLTRRFGEVRVLRAALLASAAGFVIMTQAGNLVEVLLSSGFFVFANAMLNPAVSSLISKSTSGSQGATMGLNNSFQSLGRIIGPLWAGAVFDLGLNLPYLSGALILLVGLGVSLRFLHIQPDLATEEQAAT